MSHWRDRLQQGSFRGVEFHFESAQGQGGRRVALHQFPGREDHNTEDLGKSARTQRLTVYVTGNDADLHRDKLIAALDKSGPGTLVHPHVGTVNIQIHDYDYRITTREGGFTRFNIEYYLAGKPVPAAVNNTAQVLKEKSAAVSVAVAKQFSGSFTVEQKPSRVIENSENTLLDAFDALNKINGEVSAVLNDIDSVRSDINNLTDELTTLMQAPQRLLSSIEGIMVSVLGAYNSITSAFDGYSSLMDAFVLDDAFSRTSRNGVATDTRAAIADNQQASSLALRGALTNAAASLLVKDGLFESSQDANSVRDLLLENIDDLAADESLSYDAYNAYTELQLAVSDRCNSLASNAQTLETVTLNATLPALVVAHEFMGSASLADELITRNKIKNPNFVPANVKLEVLK